MPTETTACPDQSRYDQGECCGHPDNCAGPGFEYATSGELARALGDPNPEKTGREIDAIVRRGSIHVVRGESDVE